MTQPEMIHGLLRPMAERIERLEATNRDLLAALKEISAFMCPEACQDEDVCPECPASNDAEHDVFVESVMIARAAIDKAERD